jgi:hypothetical protein
VEDLTDYELQAAEQRATDLVDRNTAGDAADALTLRRLIAEVRRRRVEFGPPATNEQGGKHHEITLEESTGMETK